MQMSVGEIKRSYEEAKCKQKQIGILAELNACTKEDIEKIIDADNKRNEKHGEVIEIPSEEVKTVTIMEKLYARLDELERDIKLLEGEYKKVCIAVDVLGNMKEV